MRKYRLVAKKGEGTFSEVLKAQNVKDGRYHAIKCMKNRFESIDQVNNLREIQALRRLSPHDHIVSLEEVLYDQPTGRLALVFELMDANLYELIRGRRHYLNPQLVKMYMWQLMKALDHMHKKGIFHRDIKPENILIESNADIGRGLKLADFGSCRGIYSKQPYTEYISTRWYRAPECLLTDGYYGPEMDMWGAGCVMFEITSLYPLFPGSNEADQIHRIHKVVGTPSPEILQKFKNQGASHVSFDFPPQKGIGIPPLIPHATPDCIDIIVKQLIYDASERVSAREAMRHPYFKEVRENEGKKINNESHDAQINASSTLEIVSKKTNPTPAPNIQKNTNTKALPSLVGNDIHQGNGESHFNKQIETSPIAHKSLQVNKHSTLPVGAGQGISNTSSLPPIAIVAANTTGALKNLKSDTSAPNTTRSNLSLQQTQPSQPVPVIKKKKKNDKNINTLDPNRPSKKNGEQVLKAYGLSVTSGGSVIDESKIDGKPSGGGYHHPNRHIVKR